MNAAEHILKGGLNAAGSEKLAIDGTDENLTYGALTARVGRFAAALRDAGLRPGDRVAMLMLDTADLVALHLAVVAAGGVAVPLSTRAAPADLAEMWAVMRPFAVAIDEEFADLVADSLAAAVPTARLLRRGHELAAWKTRPETNLVPCPRNPTDPAYWVMTSGTTGRPKAVEHRHDNVLWCTDYLDHGLGATAGDRFLATSRLHFAYALGTTLFGALRIGATTILHERWPTPASVAATVERHQPTIVFSVPTLYHKLLEAGLSQGAAFRTVRRYVSAGERLSPKIGAAWQAATGRPVLDAMSCSELVHKVFTNTPTSRRAGSSGRPMPGVEVRLVDRDGIEVTKIGQTGHLEVRAPFLCAGYRTADALPGEPIHRPHDRFKNGWFATGDEYSRDEDGFFYHCGRSDDMLKVAGLWVSPAEIEDHLAGITSIAEAAAVAAETSAGLQEIVLYIAPLAGTDGDATLAQARERLARSLPPSKLPRRYVIVNELPRTATGKIQRHKLRAEAR